MKKLFASLRYLLLFAVGIGLLYFAFRGQDFGELKQKLQNANYSYVGLSMIMGLIAFWSRAERWRLLLEPMGHRTRSSSAFIAFMVGYLANLALPRLGEVLRCTLLNRLERTPIEACLGTVVAERVFDMIMLALVLGLTLLLEFELLSGFLVGQFSEKMEGTAQPASNTIYWVLAAAAAFSLLLLWLIYRYHHFLHRYTFYAKAATFAKGVGKGLISVRNLQRPWAFVLHTVLIWVMYYGMTYIVFFSLPETAVLGWQSGLAILVLGGLGMVAPVQGGIGAFHYMVKEGLLVLYKIEESVGLSLATILHGSQVIFIIVVGGICLLLSIARLREKKSLKIEG